MITAPVQSDIDGIPKGSHYARVGGLPVGQNMSIHHDRSMVLTDRCANRPRLVEAARLTLLHNER